LYISFHPFTVACSALLLSGLSIITAKAAWLYEHRYAWPRAKSTVLSPSFLFAAVAHLLVVLAFWQAIQPAYRHEWMTIVGVFVAAFPVVFAAHQSGLSRHVLFGVPYTLAWIALMFAIRAHFPDNWWFDHLQAPLFVSLGLFGALCTAVIGDRLFACRDATYRTLKCIVAAGIILCIGLTYLSLRNIDAISWQWLVTCGLLSLGTTGYFRHLTHEE
jgi:hypothetical protein